MGAVSRGHMRGVDPRGRGRAGIGRDRRRGRWVPLAALALVLLTTVLAAAHAPAALAHTDLVEASPAAGVKLADSPAGITLTFASEVDVSTAAITLYDGKGRRVTELDEPERAPGAAPAVRARLLAVLPADVYTVEWRVVSVDGHPIAGIYRFGVRETPPATGYQSMSGTTPGQAAAALAGRWLLYAGLVALVGAALTSWMAFGGRITQSGQWFLRGAWLLAAAGILTSMLAQRSIVGVPSLLPLFLTPEGAALADVGRAVIACGVAILVVFLWPHRVSLAVVSAVAVVAMLLHVLTGHADAAAGYRLLAVVDQWIHMVGVGVWLGGLAWLVLGLRGLRPDERAEPVRRFSVIATAALVPVLVTGVLRALDGIGSPSDLVTTGYGITLLVKVGLVVALVALGAFNHYRVVPGLSRDVRQLAPFRLTSRGELALAGGILAATAVLTGLAPSVVG